MFVVCDDNVRVYSTTTGEWIRELQGISDKRIIGQQCDPNNGKLLYGCTQSGDVISWKWESGVVNEKQSLKFLQNTKAIVNSFALISIKNSADTFGVITWRHQIGDKFKIGIFNLTTGQLEDFKLPFVLK